MLLALQLEQVNHFAFSCWFAWELLQQGSPLLGHVDAVGFFCFLAHRESLRPRVVDQITHLLGEEGVTHVPEVFPAALPTEGKFFREVGLQLWPCEHLRVPRLDRELIIAGDDDLPDLCQCQEPLVAHQHRLQVIFGHLVLGEQVQLLQNK